LNQFNWYELKSGSGNVPEGIITLTYALTKGYNSVISSSESLLLYRLNIDHIPQIVYRKSYIVKSPFGLLNKYTPKEPQCYFLDTEWLTVKESVYNKMVYMYALSQRSINNKNLFIPDIYLDSKYWDNPYLEHKDEKLWFKPELTHIKNNIIKRR
jgi:hypothetical protein